VSSGGDRPPPDPRVPVGVVAKPFGVRGEVYVRPDPDLDHDFAEGTAYRLADGRTLTVAERRLHGTRLVVRFAEAADREAAEGLRGAVLTVPRSDVAVGEDAFWVADVLGRAVRDDAGELVGVVESVRDGYAHDYLVVARPDGGEILVPLVADLVTLRDDAVVVRAIPGLLDDDSETA
jgi:16S rRNA processing protein RimM